MSDKKTATGKAAGDTRGRTRGRAQDSRTSNSRAAARREREARRESNPFVNSQNNNSILPHVPDDENYHYAWMRGMIDGKTDGGNLTEIMNGPLKYEPVPKDELPKGVNLAMLVAQEGEKDKFIRARDTVLMRCDVEQYMLWVEAAELKADDLDDMVNHGGQAKQIDGEERTGIVVEENQNRSGVRGIDE